ncbi:hypothetical protein AB0K93_02025 [Streptomyces sp. NPDC052676]|uniref:hypothetical protein n=1 Tax=Streptomyces sp. NPDC052676 TaxID=3154953 RepID=UPI00344A98CF
MKKSHRFGIIAGTTIITSLFFTSSNAFAWSSYLTGVRVGFASRTWGDHSYTEINFTRCTTDFSGRASVDVQLVRVDTTPDTYYDTKHFTECFTLGDGDETSTGTWSGLPAGDYRFFIKAINNADVNVLSVADVTVDTTKAD